MPKIEVISKKMDKILDKLEELYKSMQILINGQININKILKQILKRG